MLAGLSFWIVIYGSAAGTPSISRVVGSRLFYLGITGAFAAMIWALRLLDMAPRGSAPGAFGIVIAAAVLFRLLALPAGPVLTDDIYRYLWDGHLQSQGLNPYSLPPGDPALDPVGTPYRERINNPELPTIYPPAAQVVFLVAALLPGGLLALKAILVLLDLGTILVIAAILRERGAHPARCIVYAWSPLAVIEVAWSGHVDPVGVFFLALGALGIIKSRPVLSMTATALSGAAKYVGWIGFLPFRSMIRTRSLAIAAAALGAIYVPYLTVGTGVIGSLPEYAERWRFNDSIFGLIHGSIERLGLSEAARSLLRSTGLLEAGAVWDGSLVLRLTAPLSLAKLLAAGFFLALAVRYVRKGWKDPLRELVALLGTALILSPTVHPWYLLWVAPFLALVPRLSWLWLTYAVLLFAYPDVVTRTGIDEPLRWLAWIEYAPFFILLAVESARRRLWDRD